jgi:carbonic anhydrase
MRNGAFAAAINCMDGRVIEPVMHWMREQLGVDYVDMITEAGPDLVLNNGSPHQVENIKRRVLVSVDKHRAQTVAIVAHHDCAGNPVSLTEHLKLVQQGMDVIRDWVPGTQIIGLWVDKDGVVKRIEELED